MSAAHVDATRVLVELRGLDLDTPTGRPLIHDLSAALSGGDRVALIGRNGAGKTSLLRLIAGLGHAHTVRGHVLTRGTARLVGQDPSLDEGRERGRALLVRRAQDPRLAAIIANERRRAGLEPVERLLDRPALSRGELRKLSLLAAICDRPELLLLDEPTQDLDARGLAWLHESLVRWTGALLVASHSRRLLAGFEHFFVVAESGCRYLPGRFDAVEAQLEREALAREARYVEGLAKLEQNERHNRRVCQRRARKKNLGRLHELGRRTSKARLNQKASYAQESQARVAKIRAARIEGSRGWAKAMRRALRVQLPLDALVAELPPDDGRPVVTATGVGVCRGERAVVAGLELSLGRERLAITGPNGSGKTTLLKVLTGSLEPEHGCVAHSESFGIIEQGAANWVDERSLLEALVDETEGDADALGQAAQLVLAHRFPLALARRPIAELSPGERVRAALICLYRRRPAVELLVLDEPTVSLDFVGLRALTEALQAWPGALIVTSHDQEFLDAVGFDRRLELGAAVV